jgi:tetratricopeptide (TPR) repeat protein
MQRAARGAQTVVAEEQWEAAHIHAGFQQRAGKRMAQSMGMDGCASLRFDTGIATQRLDRAPREGLEGLRPREQPRPGLIALPRRAQEGRGLLEEAIQAGIRTGGLQHHALWVAWLIAVCCLARRDEEAWQHARQALDLARQHKERGNEALALHQHGVVHAYADPPDTAQAAAHYQQALALAEALGMRPLQAHCHRGLGTLYATIGQEEQACAELSTAITLYRAMEITFWLPETEAALAQVEGHRS